MKRQVKKFERRLNPDTATAEKIQQTNEELYKYLQEKGEKDAAKQLEYLMNNQVGPEKEDPKRNPIYDKLLVTNNKILDILAKMQRDMLDEQDTSIKSVEKVQKEAANDAVVTPIVQEAANDTLDESGGLSIDLPDRLSRKGKQPGKGKGKGEKPGRGPDKKPRAPKTPGGKMPKKTSKVPKIPGKGGKAAGKAATKVGGRIAGKALAGALKFAGPIGALVTAGLAAYDAKEGWDNAGETFGLEDGEEATIGQKASSAAGSAISGLTFGLADAKETSVGINNMFGGNDTIKKYEKAGIIAHHTFGKSAVKNWAGLTQLPSKEIQKIIDIDDWYEEDLNRMKAIKADVERTERMPIVTPSTTSPNIVNGQQVTPANKSVTESPFIESTMQSGAGRGVSQANTYAKLGTGTVQPIRGDEEIKAMIKRHEGVRNKPYKDSLGLWTVGVGHLIGDGKSLPPEWDRVFSDEEVNALFEEDYAVHKKAAEQIPGFTQLNQTGQGALTDLTFNMGGKWYKKWPKFTKSISEGNTEDAAKSLEDSKWYGQVGNRAPEIVSMVRAGNDESATFPKAGSTPVVASKNAGSGVIPQKTSEVKVASTEQTVKPTAKTESIAESSKDKREVAVNQTNQSLTAQTVAYDTGTQVKAMNMVVPVLNQSINSSKQPENIGQDRLLNLFS